MDILVKKAIKGDPKAFMELIDINELALYKAAKAILNNEEDIGDAIQETILAAYKSIGSLKKVEYFKTWLTRILINKCNDIIRKNSKIVFIDEYKDKGYTENIEENLDFKDAFEKLPNDQKVVLNLYYVSGFNSREIAEILGEKENTIKSRISRGKKQLKKIMSNSENGVVSNV